MNDYLFEIDCKECKITSYVGFSMSASHRETHLHGLGGMLKNAFASPATIDNWVHCPACDHLVSSLKDLHRQKSIRLMKETRDD